MKNHLLSQKPYPATRLQRIYLLLSGIGLVYFAASLLSTATPVSISGIINDYAAVTNVSIQSIALDDASAFSAGDKLLLIQMKGAIISTSNDSTYGDILSYGNAGNYEFHTITSVSGNTVSLAYPVCGTYTLSELVQAVRIPVYEDAIISAELTAAPWDGQKGGILALEATGTITMAANINVQGLGFRGGDLNGSAKKGGTTYICAFDSGEGGIKGEGVTEVASAACRGKMANGGGGGNDHNAGGGGGGNYGSGGVGGHGWRSNSESNLSDLDKGGIGGLSLQEPYDSGIPKLFLGGGGGGGQQNNGWAVPAANGSGIVIMIANTLELTEPVHIHANALDATDVNFNDGGGGGGAGGSVLLDVQNYLMPENLNIDVSGGDGATITTADQHGPGGGGAGGYVNSPYPIPSGITVDLSGGEAGLFVSTRASHSLSHTTHGATAGSDGALVSNLVLQQCSAPPVLDLDKFSPSYNYSATHYLMLPSTPLALLNQVEITDDDDTHMELLIVELQNPLNGHNEFLSILGDLPVGLSASFQNNNHRIVIQGSATKTQYQQAISQINYHNTALLPDLAPRTFAMVVNDGGTESNTPAVILSMSEDILPVEWVATDVAWAGNNANIQWTTVQETGVSHFEVERSIDGQLFSSIGQHPALGGTDQQNYRFTDENVADLHQPRLYYRIRSVDFDGQFMLSPMLELNAEATAQNISLSFYPNPATELVHLTTYAPGGTLQVLDLSGKTLWEQALSHEESLTEQSLNVSQWGAGIYLIRLSNADQMETQKLIVR